MQLTFRMFGCFQLLAIQREQKTKKTRILKYVFLMCVLFFNELSMQGKNYYYKVIQAEDITIEQKEDTFLKILFFVFFNFFLADN